MTYLGRVDHQIKILGHRVELGEVEAILREEAGVDAIVAIGWPKTESGANGIVAFVGDLETDTAAVLEAARTRLPAYMVPKGGSTVWPNCRSMQTGSSIARRCSSAWRMAMQPTVETVRALIIAECSEALGDLGLDGDALDDGFDLRTNGVIDSLGFLELKMALESDLGFEIDLSASRRSADRPRRPRARGDAADRAQARLQRTAAMRQERFAQGALRRVLQLIALYGPGADTVRVRLHRWRGVEIGDGTFIGTDVLIDDRPPAARQHRARGRHRRTDDDHRASTGGGRDGQSDGADRQRRLHRAVEHAPAARHDR